MDPVIHIGGTSLWVPGGSAGLLPDLLAASPRPGGDRRRAEPPQRPAAVAAGAWRRMSRLSRAVVAAAAPLLRGRDDLHELPVLWGNAMGELVPIARFLGRVYGEGPQHASPLAFQNSVTNAPVGHLSIGLGLQGLSETLSAGGASGLAALLRGVDLLRLGRARAALVVAGDDLNESTERAWAQLSTAPPLGEAVAAVLLEQGGDGPVVRLHTALAPLADRPVLARATPLPGEGPLRAVPGSVAPEACLGLVPSGGLAAVAALAAANRTGSVVDQDGPMILTAHVLEA